MAEDWNAIAGEVDAALRSAADISQANGFTATLRIPPSGLASGPGEPPSGGLTYAEIAVLQDTRELKDVNGTLIGMTIRTLMCSATGVVPSDDWTIAVGVKVADVVEGVTLFEEIMAVRPLSPVGIAVLYEIDLAD